MIYKAFLLFLPFQFADGLLCCAEAFWFEVILLVHFLFLLPFLLVSDIKNHGQDQCQGDYCLCFLLGVYGFSSYVQVFNPF